MNTLLILYLIYLSWGTVGQGRVSFLEMARYLRCSKTHIRNTAFDLADKGLIEVIATYSDKGSKKLFMQLSTTGQDFLMYNFEAAQGEYHKHVADTIAAIKAKYAQSEYAPRKLSKKERDVVAAGQKDFTSYG